jgi:hypothetical protein
VVERLYGYSADDDVRHGHATAASLLDPILNHELMSGT